ncbi:hypothetical protein MNV49_002841 [Pseudohyphozyma bogoriensis]|nr:hypothetical protein MNV49_002841 [Pseudohyphozyma bogoriensis]
MADYNTLTGTPLASQAVVFVGRDTDARSTVDSIMGPAFVGWTVDLIFYGAVMATAFSYITSPLFAKDTKWIKALLIAVLLLSSVQSALEFTSLYHYATWQIRDADTLFAQTEFDCFATFAVGLEGAIVQTFLSLRASALFENRIYKVIYFTFVALGVLCGLIGSWCYLILSFMLRANMLEKALPMSFPVATGMWLWGSAFVDVLITVSLCVLLNKRIIGYNSSTDGVLRKIMRLAIETASYTAIAATIGAILSYAFPADSLNANSSAAFWLPLSSFYALALLITLGSRSKIRAKAIQSGVRGLEGKAGDSMAKDHSYYDMSPRPALPSPSPRINIAFEREQAFAEEKVEDFTPRWGSTYRPHA